MRKRESKRKNAEKKHVNKDAEIGEWLGEQEDVECRNRV